MLGNEFKIYTDLNLSKVSKDLNLGPLLCLQVELLLMKKTFLVGSMLVQHVLVWDLN